MLLSAGGFAIYRSESNVFNLLGPRFGGMRSAKDRKALLDFWLNSKLFQISGLDARDISARIISHCQNTGDFLRIVMQQISAMQGVCRWADCTPEHALYVEQIKLQIPNALFIHIIRDGRDVALSYAKQGWSHPFPWDRSPNNCVGVAGLYWEWLVRKGREHAERLASDYQEVRFEQLIQNPRQTLEQLGSFIDHDLDYERIQRAGIGSISEPNTSFAESGAKFDPVARWRSTMSDDQLADLESLVGDFLLELGYGPLIQGDGKKNFRAARMRTTYFFSFSAKLWMRTSSPFARLVRLERIEPASPTETIGTNSAVPPEALSEDKS